MQYHMLGLKFKIGLNRFFYFLFLAFLASIFLTQCKSKPTVSIDKVEYNFGAAFTHDTIKVKASRADVSWKLTTDNYWVVIDSQVIMGSKEIDWSVFPNTDTIAREAKIFLTGQDLDTIVINVKQDKAFPEIVIPITPKEAFKYKPSRNKKIIVEDQVESITPEGDSLEEFPGVSEADRKANKPVKSMKEDQVGKVLKRDELEGRTKVPKVQERPKAKMDLSIDEVTLGAASDLESASVTLDVVGGDWKVKTPLPDWIQIINVADGSPITGGKEGISDLKIKTKSSNKATTPRNVVLEFQMGKFSKTVKVTQKPTEANLLISSDDIKIPGEQADDIIELKVKAINTEWQIDNKSSIPDWLNLSESKGSVGETVIKIDAKDNETNEPRVVTLILVSTGNTIQKEVVITQDIQAIKIKVSKLSSDLTEKSESFATFTVASNVEWEIIKNEEIAWYSLDVINGTGGEDDVETVTVTALEDNDGTDRVDTILVVAQNIKRKVIIKQKGKIAPQEEVVPPTNVDIKLMISVDSIDWQKDISNTTPFVLDVTTNDKWTISNLPDWLDMYSVSTQQKITGADTTEKVEFRLNKSKDSILIGKSLSLIFESVNNPEINKVVYIKSKVSTVKKELKVSGFLEGNFLPYLQIGNVSSKSGANIQDKPISQAIKIYASVDFSIGISTATKEGTDDKFYSILVDKIPYVLGDIIPPGNHEIVFTAVSDNVSDMQLSKIQLFQFNIDDEPFPFVDNISGKTGIMEFELKQEPLPLDVTKPKIFVHALSFNGYSSFILLGNPKVKPIPGDTAKIESSKKVVRIKTDKNIKLSIVEDKGAFFDVYYGSNPEKINSLYKIGKTIPPGEYYFSFEARKNYTDPNGFNTRDIRTLFFESADKVKSKDVDVDETQPNLIYIDVENRDYSGSNFRTELLIEQESL